MRKIPPKGWFANTGLLYSYSAEPEHINELIRECFAQKCTRIQIGSIYQKFILPPPF